MQKGTSDEGGVRGFVVVNGWPASGKTTMSRLVAAQLGVPALAKDDIKEALMVAFGQPETVADSQRLGRAAVLAMLRVAMRCSGAVLDSTWFDYALPLVRKLPGPIVEVCCTVPLPIARARYRARSADRAAGHLDTLRSEEELWGHPVRPLGVGPVLTVDTARAVDVESVVAWIRAALKSQAGGRSAPQVR